MAIGAGIREGMDLTHARSLLQEHVSVHVEPHHAERDANALHALACWSLRFSPLATPDPPDGLVIDITGTERLHGGETRLLGDVAKRIHGLGFAVRVAAAPTTGCAWAVARFSPQARSRVAPGLLRIAIEPLPLAALRVDDTVIESLEAIGITRVKDLLALPMASIAARFDSMLVRRLRQALGESDEYLDPVRSATTPRAEMVFEGPTDRWESVEAATKQMLHELVAELVRLERGVRRLDGAFSRPHAPPVGVRIDCSHASASTRHLWTLLRSRIERIDLGEGIEGVALTASRTSRLAHQQLTHTAIEPVSDRATTTAWGELIDTLAGRLGPDRVLRMECVGSHRPERAFRARPAVEASRRQERVKTTDADRPSVLFDRPEPAQALALTPDGPPLRFSWRGQDWKVEACAGPERIADEWWRSPPAETNAMRSVEPSGAAARAKGVFDRDYFAVQLEGGRWLWVFRLVNTGRWFVHGEWS